VSGVGAGGEARGYLQNYRIHKWFTETSGLAMAERKEYLMRPPPPKMEKIGNGSTQRWRRVMG
jgi:hypothetical protein